MTNWRITKAISELSCETLSPKQKVLLLGDSHLHTVSLHLKWRPSMFLVDRLLGPGRTIENIFSRVESKKLYVFRPNGKHLEIPAKQIQHFSAIGLQLGNNTHRLYFSASAGSAHFKPGHPQEESVQYLESSLIRHCCKQQIQGLLQFVDDLRSLTDAPIFHIPGPPPKDIYSAEKSEIVMDMHQRRIEVLHQELRKRGVSIIELPPQTSDEHGYLLPELDAKQGAYREGKDRAHAGPKFGKLILNSIQEFLKQEGIPTT